MPLPTTRARTYQARHGGERSPAAVRRGLPLRRSDRGCSPPGALSSCSPARRRQPALRESRIRQRGRNAAGMSHGAPPWWQDLAFGPGKWTISDGHVSSYRGSSGDAIYMRCTSSACRLSSTCLRGSTTAWMLVGNRADEWIHFQREGCLNT